MKKILLKLFKRNKQNSLQKNNNLIEIMSNLDLIIKVYYELKYQWNNFSAKRKTKILNKIDIKILKCLSKKIKTGNYIWNNGKIIRNKIIFDFKNKIIEKLIVIILHIIYKPVFRSLKYNHGFNYQKYNYLILNQLKIQKHQWTYAFKNQIFKNNWNLNSQILRKILKKKINDFKFLRIIKNLLKTNILLKNKTIYFVFYNIYMHEFDLYLSKKIKNFNNKNTQPDFNVFSLCQKYVIKNNYAKQKGFKWKKKMKIFFSFTIKIFQKLKNYIKSNKKKQMEFEIKKKLKKNSKVIYSRFNHHWIMFVSYCLHNVKAIKKKLIHWFKKNLKIYLNKIWLINLFKNKLNYLGFTICMIFPKIKKIYYNNKIKIRKKISSTLLIGIDHKYLKNKLIEKKIITIKFKPNYISNYYNLKPLQILLKFKRKLRRLINYYYNTITFSNELNYYYYVYKFSCLKTLAVRIKKSFAYIFSTLKFTEPLKKKYIFKNYSYKNTDTK